MPMMRIHTGTARTNTRESGTTNNNSSPATPKYKKIQIKGTSGATIIVNGTKIPKKVPHALQNGQTGRYTFTITKDGYEPYSKTINAVSMGSYTINANLVQKNTPVIMTVVATEEEDDGLASILNTILNGDDDDEPEEGSYSGANIGGVAGLGSGGPTATMDAVIEETTGEVDIEQMEEELQENPEVQRVWAITEIVNDDSLTEEEKSDLLDCYRIDDDDDTGSGDSSRREGQQNSRPTLQPDQRGTLDGTSDAGDEDDAEEDPLPVRTVYKLVDRNGEEAYRNTTGEGYADFDMKYNYVSYEFEDYVLAETPPPTRLPSFANFINLGEKDIAGVNDQSAGSLEYPLDQDGNEMLPREPRTYFGTLLTRPEAHKFDHYRMEYRSAGSVSIYYNDLFSALQRSEVNFGNLEHLNRNYIFYEPFVQTMREKQYLKEHFPTYINIELSSFAPVRRKNNQDFNLTDKDAEKTIAALLKKTNMHGVFMNAVMSKILEVPDNVFQDQVGAPIKFWKNVSFKSTDINKSSPYNTDNSIHFFGPQSDESELDGGTYDSALSDVTTMTQDQNGRWLGTTHRETIMFKVSKYKQGSPDPIQDFFFFNDSMAAPIQFIDTQLNLAETYEYRVFAYDIVKAGASKQIANIIEYETFRQSDVYIVSKPPMPPDVTIAPYLGSETDMLFLFNDSSGKVLMEPIHLDSGDEDRLNKIRKIYGKKIPNPDLSEEEFENASDSEKFKNFIEYEYDGSSIFFEVYRTTAPPRSYEDFAGKRHARTTGTSFKDSIAPNRKYYYTFRCMDNHGNFSNPSAVFEVEIVKTFNVFPNIRVYEFPDTVRETRETKRNMKRFLRIVPDTKFMFVRENTPTSVGRGRGRGTLSAQTTLREKTYTMGADNIIESLWGKKFKLRMTSKTTGKKIDLNFSFTKSFIGNT